MKPRSASAVKMANVVKTAPHHGHKITGFYHQAWIELAKRATDRWPNDVPVKKRGACEQLFQS